VPLTADRRIKHYQNRFYVALDLLESSDVVSLNKLKSHFHLVEGNVLMLVCVRERSYDDAAYNFLICSPEQIASNFVWV
jgi:uncharacterized protein (DUF362 family)